MDLKLHTAYIWLSSLLSAFGFVYLIYKYVLAVRNRPCIHKGDIVFQEWFASGCSMKNIQTKLGGARGVLRLVVTNDLLWVTSWFPFSLIAPFYDMEHVIPLNQITDVAPNEGFMSRGIRLSYVYATGEIHSLTLIPKDEASFLRVLADAKQTRKSNRAFEPASMR